MAKSLTPVGLIRLRNSTRGANQPSSLDEIGVSRKAPHPAATQVKDFECRHRGYLLERWVSTGRTGSGIEVKVVSLRFGCRTCAITEGRRQGRVDKWLNPRADL